MIVVCTASALKIRSLPDLDEGTDLGKRIFSGQSARVWGESLDKKWWYIDAPAARGWASKGYLVQHLDEIITSPSWPSIPSGRAQIEKIFGPPGKPICSAGRVLLPAGIKISWGDTVVTVLACHKLLEDVFTSVFKSIYDKGLWGLIEDYGGIYNSRPIKASSKPSTHSWGIAIDLNTLSNPLGARPKMDPRITAIFVDHGFTWGGVWTQRPDGMHYQWARDY